MKEGKQIGWFWEKSDADYEAIGIGQVVEMAASGYPGINGYAVMVGKDYQPEA